MDNNNGMQSAMFARINPADGLAPLIATLQGYQAEMERLNRENKELKTRIDRVRADNDGLKATNARLGNSERALQAEVAELRGRGVPVAAEVPPVGEQNNQQATALAIVTRGRDDWLNEYQANHLITAVQMNSYRYFPTVIIFHQTNYQTRLYWVHQPEKLGTFLSWFARDTAQDVDDLGTFSSVPGVKRAVEDKSTCLVPIT